MIADSALISAPTRTAITINLISLALIIWGVTSGADIGPGGARLVTLVSLVVASLGWLIWSIGRHVARRRFMAPALIAMAVGGGVLSSRGFSGVFFVGVACLAACLEWPVGRAMWLVGLGPAAGLVTELIGQHHYSAVGIVLAAACAGSALGVTRRQSLEHARQVAHMEVAQARADAEQARAELLAGRNHLARELHDVLAHTLSALSLQLEALDARVSSGPPVSVDVREQLDLIKRLVREGLAEAKGAVTALREDAAPLHEQLEKLAAERQATLTVAGTPRRLGPEVGLALFRVAQEALTNTVKHAPGADVQVELTYSPETVTLTIANDLPDGPTSDLAATGGGYGLQGIRERILLIGGQVSAGPVEDGWLVEAGVPL